MDISPEIVWLVLALIAGGVEMMTGTVFLLVVAGALAVAALLALVGLGLTVQLAAIALVVVAGSLLVQRWRKQSRGDTAVSEPDVGRVIEVSEVNADGTATVMYRGAPWPARAAEGGLSAGRWKIVALDGPCLVLQRADG